MKDVMNMIKLDSKSVPMIRALFPDYRKRQIVVWPTETVTIYDLNWSGGTRAQYHAIDLVSGQLKSFAHWSSPPPWDNPHEGARVNLLPGYAVAKTGDFCGKTATLYLYVHPADIPKLLPAP